MFLDEKTSGEAARLDLGTLRVDRILALAEEIENPTLGLGFNMRVWLEDAQNLKFGQISLRAPKNFCGTAACIGGHAEMMFCRIGTDWYSAADSLGLTEDQEDALFYPDQVNNWENINRARAARVLRHLAATGKVDWSV